MINLNIKGFSIFFKRKKGKKTIYEISIRINDTKELSNPDSCVLINPNENAQMSETTKSQIINIFRKIFFLSSMRLQVENNKVMENKQTELYKTVGSMYETNRNFQIYIRKKFLFTLKEVERRDQFNMPYSCFNTSS